MNLLTIRLGAIILWAVLATVPVRAGGTTEAPEPVEPAATTEPAGTTDAEAQMKTLLDGIGIRTFEGDIAAVDFGIPRLGGDQTSLSDFQGEFVFLNFWATWCPPCREEMPSMDAMHAELEDLPLRILAVNVQESPDVVESFVREEGYRFPVLLDESGRVAAHYGVRGIPTTYFISPAGRVLGMLVGTRYWDEPDVLDTMREIARLAATLQG